MAGTATALDSDAELDSYMMDYHPYRGGPDSKQSDSQTLRYMKRGWGAKDRKEAFKRKIKDWLQSEIKKIDGRVVVAVAPGYKASRYPSGFVHDVVNDVVEKWSNVEKMKLIRTKDIPKQSTSSGVRSKATHEGTIDVKGTASTAGKTVIIVDDIWTSGNTLRACRDVVIDKTKAGVNNVKLFAIGRTIRKLPRL